MELTLELMTQLIKLAVDNKLDRLKLGDFEVIKTKHEFPLKEKANNSTSNGAPLDDDELLFWSTSSPAFTQEQIEALAVNSPLVKPKKQRKSKDS